MRRRFARLAIGGLLALLMLMTLGVGVLWVLGGGRPKITVDYITKINERAAAVPEGDRAWPIYLALAPRLDSFRSDSFRALLEESASDNQAMERLAILLSRNDHVVDLIRDSAAKPGLGYVVNRENQAAYRAAARVQEEAATSSSGTMDWLFEADFPALADMRSMALALSGDSRIAALRGDGPRVIHNSRAQFVLSDHASEHGAVICQLVAFAIRNYAITDLAWVLDVCPDALSAEELHELDALLFERQAELPYQVDFSYERFVLHDVIQRCFTDDGRGNGRVTVAAYELLEELGDDKPMTIVGSLLGRRIETGLLRFTSLDRVEATDIIDGYFDGLQRWGTRPRREWPATPPDPGLRRLRGMEEDRAYDLGARAAAALLPAFGKTVPAADRTTARLDALRLRVAMARYHRASGDWPGSTADLVPAYLDRWPTDPFSDAPLRTVIRGNGVTVYSVGTDRDDDGGRSAGAADRWMRPEEGRRQARETPEAFDGDWILLIPP